MEARVLGTAQDGGVPHLGCSCALCERARVDPTCQKYASSVLLAGRSGRYLIDATPDVRFQVGGSPVDGIFLSHEHLGHLAGLLYFGPESLDATEVPVHCTPQLAEFVRTNEPFAGLVAADHVSLVTCRPDSRVDLGDCSVVPREVRHRTEHAETLAYEISCDRTLLYMSDLDGWTDRTIQLVADADVALVDGCFWHPDELDRYDEVPHPAIVRSMEVLDQEATDIYFTHLNHTNPVLGPDSGERRRVEDRGFHVAERGDTFEL